MANCTEAYLKSFCKHSRIGLRRISLTPTVQTWVTVRMLVPLLGRELRKKRLVCFFSFANVELEVQRAHLCGNSLQGVGNLSLALPRGCYNGLQPENLACSKFGVTRLFLRGKIVSIYRDSLTSNKLFMIQYNTQSFSLILSCHAILILFSSPLSASRRPLTTDRMLSFLRLLPSWVRPKQTIH